LRISNPQKHYPENRPESDIFDVYNERDMECFFEKILNWILRRRWFPGMQHALDQC
jgi:hypothetical protein